MAADTKATGSRDIIVIGIAGGTGSGKTTITRKIAERFGSEVTVLYHDNYYKARHDLTYDERVRLNYDHPDAFDTDRMIEDLARLKRGETIECPLYDYTIYDRSDQILIVRPTRVIIVEGILIFHSKSDQSHYCGGHSDFPFKGAQRSDGY